MPPIQISIFPTQDHIKRAEKCKADVGIIALLPGMDDNGQLIGEEYFERTDARKAEEHSKQTPTHVEVSLTWLLKTRR